MIPPARTPKDEMLDLIEYASRMRERNEGIGYQLAMAEIDRRLSVAQPPATAEPSPSSPP